MNILPLVFSVGIASCFMTLLLRHYALKRSLIDIPNDRSSHILPTPRGGGVAIVICFFVALLLLAQIGFIERSACFGLLGSGALVALIGFADDHGHIAARWRLLGHFAAAAWGLYWLGGLTTLTVMGQLINLGWMGNFLALVYLVWMLNLYNFMDGIDGLASVEALTACLGMCLIYWSVGAVGLIWAPLILIGAVSGFLCWNFPPARIFMGDAGSGFLGITLGGMALWASTAKAEFLWCWLILLGFFVVDATLTLLRRLLQGKKIYQAHRSHAYQRAARAFNSHKKVTLFVGAVNIVWLLPIAIIVARGFVDGFIAMGIAYLPIVLLVLKFGAEEET
jgi:Fuc2NAc and GlcNAc transferase